EAVALGGAEALAELDRFVEHHLERRLRLRHELEGADVEDRALHRREPAEIALEVRHDERLQLVQVLAHPAHQRLRERAVAALIAFQAARRLERIAARELPGVERLQRDLARLAPSALHAAAA